MTEYLKYRCCMCPNTKTPKRICPGIAGTPHPNESPCRFVKTYQDKRGWQYFVHPGIGGDIYKTFYRKPGGTGAHGCRSVGWRGSFDEAQADLNLLAETKKWNEATI